MRKGILLCLFLCVLGLVACESDPPAIAFTEIDLSQADAGSGEKLFQQANGASPPCSSCHLLEGSNGIAPSLSGYANRAGSQVRGQGAEEYSYWSIVRPARYLVAGFSNVMYAEYEKHLSAQDIADMIAYLLTFE